MHNRDEELEKILTLENAWSTFTEEEKRTWYIVESGWIRTWLSYVRYGTASLGESLSSPAPPPINNEYLLLLAADDTELLQGNTCPHSPILHSRLRLEIRNRSNACLGKRSR